MIAGIIPARYGSTRFPGKPLTELAGKTMIRRVYEQATRCRLLSEVIVATDDQRVADHVFSFGGHVVMTAPGHPSGTDRCREAARALKRPANYIINIQGDEPLIDPLQIDELAAVLADGSIEIATQVAVISDPAWLFDKNVVKAVINGNSEALYFSRLPVPCIRGVEEKDWLRHHTYFRHVGMYAYRSDILEKITLLAVSPLEKAESLEQLRWLEAGFRIRCVRTAFESISVDTPADAERVRQLLVE